MGSLNVVHLIGHLGRDAELRYTPGGDAVATLNLATSKTWKNKAGERQERTEWHRIVLWGKTAEALAAYLLKGKQICVSGELQTRSWEDKDGTKRYTTEIRGNHVVLLGSAPKPDSTRHVRDEDVGHGEPVAQAAGGELTTDLSDDVPF